eukprot:gnl/TRDRNA2_/TRDRNA2_164947_c0_seq2.p1 gnl/TRDRNA2_/TRDRNA2_164947_c0~~gnl/TRDRNA2_/TRDRNA2_164947_c0_seq2.p1  ORF type:complete len:273 (-),score=50.22 gnl/TRDRNA2_/TRDRNA2_164947_c0_seq2:141-959(-)
MMTWAASGKFPGAAFLCICVDPNAFATAREFAQLYFKFAPDCLRNGYIDNQRDFPTFQANLGCQGFTIFNSAHKISVAKTLPWTEYRDRAFRDLESSLRKLVQTPALESALNAPVGQHVKIANHTSAEEISVDVPSVNHAGMDSQHESCAEALRTLTMQRSVVSLRRVRDELAEHFKEEEALLQDSGFGQKVNGNDFSAFDSHAKDHQRIVALADAALLALANVCEASQGSVSEQVVVNLRRAFAEHAQLYDTLYADKLVAAPVGSCCQKSG